MATLNLHLDFMEDKKPIRFKTLSSEEELQIVQDSTKLLEEINEDFRILDKMCSALDNLIIIKEHYEQYGTSPALEALVGDIKQYLGISTEADEGEGDSDGSEKKEGGGIGGAIAKIWQWFCRLLDRIGKWLGLCEKVAESSRLDDDVKFNSSSKYDIEVSPLVFSDGKIVKRVDEIKKIKNQVIRFADYFVKTDSTSSSSGKSESTMSAREYRKAHPEAKPSPIRKYMPIHDALKSQRPMASMEAKDEITVSKDSGTKDTTISVDGSGGTSAFSFDDMLTSIKKLKDMSQPVKQSISGDMIVALNHAAYDFYKETKSAVEEIKKKFNAVSDKITKMKKSASADQSKAFGMVREVLSSVNKAVHNVIHVGTITKKIVYPNQDKKKEEKKPEQQEQKPAEASKSEEKKPEEAKQPEQKPEEKK